ncbi:MAG: monofunctional biosynthetic peptidoglycan transglycosylase [Hyphomicrobiaceae bacterium]
MTSVKGPLSEPGDASPDLDVLAGPPAAPAVAAEVAREATEPPKPEPEPEPIAEAALDEAPPPVERLDTDEPAPDVREDLTPVPASLEALDGSEDIATPEQTAKYEPDVRTRVAAPASEEIQNPPDQDLPVEPAPTPAETSATADEIVVAPEIAEEPPAEMPKPEVAVDAPPPEQDIFEPQAVEALSVPAELVEPAIADTGIDSVDHPADPVTVAATEAAPDLAPLYPEPTAPTPALEILAPLVAPAIADAIVAPSALRFDPPTQPAPPLPPPPIATTIAKSVRAPWQVWLRRMFLALVGLATGYAALVVVLIGVYRFVDPPRSTVMLGLMLTGQSVDYEPVPITSISSYLQRAVVTSEDARFCRHSGVDWGALAEAMQDSRGGSTITMQTAKNLFLWPSRSYIRKAIEIPVALAIDFAWPKRRILEVYLNIAEWGPGIFGAEMAAQYHFNKSASRLTQHEATLLAASLPNPIAREAGDPGRITELLALRLRGRMANSDAYVSCLGLRPMPHAAPERAPKSSPAATKPAQKSQPWQTKTEPAKPPAPFNPWQN